MKLTWRRLTLVPRHPFATARGGVDQRQSLIVELAHEGVTGLGEATPSDLYGQSVESTEAALAQTADLLGDDPFLIEPILARVIERHDGQRAAVAALDSALHDWVGRKLGVPVWRLLGLSRPRVTTTFTIGVASPAEIREKLDEALAAGYSALKVKVGVAHDHETLSIVRERFSGPLLLDANCAFSPEDAADRLRDLAGYCPAMIEQPLAPEHWRSLRALRELGLAPIYADESCERPADVVRLHGCVDGVNIKFGKCGGIREALRMVALARGLGMGVMLGCFVSSSLAIAPALTIATLADFIDLDGHLLLRDDPYGGIAADGGTISLGDQPGLGVAARR